ncbi:CRISPR-associated helicase/endonuclease Cas3 [Actinomyces sp. S4-C9]|uniref:CRISPR-associated helicase/endonuclease Cas3 n=1 Tax=Actinomyces sp. S4-C9 TaxID=1219581 RepID=UPI00050F149F|nr:CRISPR-associated helicase/endonuclease Cas3 [Actinomyces sp. S4-C9]KGF01654.1 hypothetical protein HMPREF1628_04910 [Actinomyces sp. S4-C9]
MLNAATRKLWAKSSNYEGGQPTAWLPLYLHSMDAMGVADKCLEEWIAPMQFETLMNQSPRRLSKEAVKALARFLVGAHDIGKASPPFSGKVPALHVNVIDLGFDNPSMLPKTRSVLKHGLVGAEFVTDYLLGRSWGRSTAVALGSVVGGHHGVPASIFDLNDVRGSQNALGSKGWVESRAELLDWLFERSGMKAFEDEVRDTHWTQAALVVLEGLTIISDWIASNDRYFPIFPVGSQEPQKYLENEELFRQRVERGWNLVHISPTWEATSLEGDADEVVRRRFGLGPSAVARPLQAEVLNVAREMDAPGILLIEDVMGAGKTEAGLLAAEILAQRSGASGILMVLPTQSTTDSMFARVKNWVESGTDLAGNASRATMALMHGKAQMNELYQNMEFANSYSAWDFGFDSESYTPSIPDASESKLSVTGKTVRSPWMSGKKSLLSEIVVATIDQLLMVALRARYLALRHMGISRKVVVIDEVHAADVYMREYLYTALEWLGAYGVPVVALSATLSPSIRQEITDAYGRGAMLRDEVGEKKTARARKISDSVDGKPDLPYPVLTYTKRKRATSLEMPQALPAKCVNYEFVEERDIPGLASRLLDDGGCLLVVRNTVKDAQKVYGELQKLFGEDVRLVHARFTSKHRSENDGWLLKRFGKPDPDVQRPKRQIVVATQVVEQSLDLDFDAIITDLAPIDLVFQRIGRVHRHERERPERLRTPKCFLVGVPDLGNDTPQEMKSIKWNVYEPLHLLRTAELLRMKQPRQLVIPDEIPELTFQVFDCAGASNPRWETAESGLEQQAADVVRFRKGGANAFRLRSPSEGKKGLTDWLYASTTDDDAFARAKVRDGEDSIEVLLVEDEGTAENPVWKIFDPGSDRDARFLPMNGPISDEEARLLSESLVRLPGFAADVRYIDKILDQLSYHVDDWQKNRLIAGQLVLPLRDGQVVLAGRKLRYTRERGLEEVKDD